MRRVALAILAFGFLPESHASAVPLPLAVPAGEGAPSGSQSNHWAVIVAGSNGYGNYRHQADAAHAYQRLLASGIPSDQIITFIDGGIANDPYNPVPGKVFNKPDPNGPGQDVWDGLKLSYSGAAVTAANLYAVLRGNASGVSGGSGEVLRSNATSHVMLAYFDHGATGILGMPMGPYVYADDLNATFTAMREAGLYGKLTVYVEACESGSMFSNVLSDRVSIYATTASNPDESSWGTYCYPDDMVTVNNAPVHLNTCMGDLYSVSWLENADTVASEKIKESLAQQYFLVRNRTYMSHVMQYGDTGFINDSIWAFEGGGGHNGADADAITPLGHTAAAAVPSTTRGYPGGYAAGAGSSQALAALHDMHAAAAAASARAVGHSEFVPLAGTAAGRVAKRAARMGKRGRQQAMLGGSSLSAAPFVRAQASSAMSGSHWDARTASLQSLWLRYAQANAAGDAVRADALYVELANELQRNARFHDAFTAIAQRELGEQSLEVALQQQTTVTQWTCYKAVNNALVAGAACGPYTDVALQYARLVSRLCDAKGGDAAAVMAALHAACSDAVAQPTGQSASALSEAAASWA